jgi:hypothetical protein
MAILAGLAASGDVRAFVGGPWLTGECWMRQRMALWAFEVGKIHHAALLRTSSSRWQRPRVGPLEDTLESSRYIDGAVLSEKAWMYLKEVE